MANVLDGNFIADMSYEPFGRLKGITYGNGEQLIVTRGIDGRLDGRRLYRVSDNVNLSHLTYGYDLDDNITQITDVLDAGKTSTFAYDSNNRMKRVMAASGAIRRTDYAFDANGNRTEVLTRPLPDDAASAALTERYAKVAGTNKLASISAPALSGTAGAAARSITYDARGNMLTETRPNSVNISAGYDGYARCAHRVLRL